jgi:hypothetical protein
VANDPEQESGPRCIEVPFFVAPGNGEHAWQHLYCTCSVTIASDIGREVFMRVMVERCCGLDVHQESVVACLLIGAPGARPTKEVRTFGTMTRELEALRDWLKSAEVTHVGMESTGVYWRPVYTVLEGHFELIVGNARHIRNVPGRKTDIKDAEWIADLIRHGLVAKSFVPTRPLRELRELLRYRRKLVESQSAERNRLLKLLETANIKLASVTSDVFGVSGWAMLKTLSEGNASAEDIAGLAKGQLRRNPGHDQLAEDVGCCARTVREGAGDAENAGHAHVAAALGAGDLEGRADQQCLSALAGRGRDSTDRSSKSLRRTKSP